VSDGCEGGPDGDDGGEGHCADFDSHLIAEIKARRVCVLSVVLTERCDRRHINNMGNPRPLRRSQPWAASEPQLASLAPPPPPSLRPKPPARRRRSRRVRLTSLREDDGEDGGSGGSDDIAPGEDDENAEMKRKSSFSPLLFPSCAHSAP